ncbi:hypothetical protein Lesp02_58100 [Lentzea sp. NBRC 105346]|uniref:hypothetical protein n=1 Tax=Lentzea sp. NBRC 105346 TaxID=3032205 RepID=UPI0024A4A80F|nr:hypothetical protein [Lentzea sp. NBRC 105346]GLZ33622.1 hypothetical protein Lesp02_58100 [Lentzea sp. NBRC 105346]
MGLWDHYEVLSDEHRAELDTLTPEERVRAMDRWLSRSAAVAAMRDAVSNTACVLDTMVDLLIMELNEQEDATRRDALVDFMMEICRTAGAARAFVDGRRPDPWPSLEG